MTTALPDLVVSRCESCHARFLPRPGPCPTCGSTALAPHSIPPTGTVLAAVELLAPAAGWSSPHRLSLVAAAEEVRILALVEGALPVLGAAVSLEAREGRFVARAAGVSGPAT